MNYCITDTLLNEICIIKSESHHIIGRISKIYSDKFAVEMIHSKNNSHLKKNEEVKVLIESKNNEVFTYEAKIVSDNILSDHEIAFIKPISKIHDVNKREFQRLNMERLHNPIKILFRPFPPMNHGWDSSYLIDISQGGLQVRTRKFYSKNQLIEVKIGYPFLNSIEEVIGRIVHVYEKNDEYIISINFLNLSDMHKVSIEKYIENAYDRVAEISE